ncbi:adenosylcobinamide kinase /adenosylcobinamide-phosphate guanylyltransferase [Desulfatibacillum alkenivorans DSM 16219]|jgi:adenosylcobinamide kinase/adenosylcobinamide-phosphate guanylyltransferase|uniref:Adenosylcobinamide kinase n=1 Tax=Desulfatibacillum alkenivorans DSM 16219 TaxID=1121393 RepID=A0A1M6U9Y8_9BACT|nr:bifunctional adenosylcobinamide kinase/adenosylcobinamide-phosphate guanylyltransferase [Desulfatibacillum alkenivorans]SHK66062.1 adenosylcobinamide kinase /adenosylcobinamide-phosphate guanylyltransferase [Desulfatibacillum alkenivorans DSM 16219]
MKPVLVIGGCRSGKSSIALDLANAQDVSEKVFIATCQPLDDEMEDRVARHQADRGDDWQTVEEPVELAKAVADNARPGRVILVDCLTLWISNLVLADKTQDQIADKAKELAEAIQKAPCPVILVSNEVGAGIVPENALSRLFRDAAGKVNQIMAKACDQVQWVVAGIPVTIKG